MTAQTPEVITHGARNEAYGQRTVHLLDGKIVREEHPAEAPA